ncbi:MAG: penicillin-binding transpeptidase domain-containing protein [Pseudonocardiaceae bacterium]
MRWRSWRPAAEQHRVLALAANLDYGRTEAAGQTTYPLPSSPAPLGAGSVYKIFTAAVAMQRGLDLDTPIPVPDTYVSKRFTDDGEPYTVHNLGDYPPSLTLQQALAQSPNTAFVALEDRIGSVDPIVEMAYRLGMRESLQAPAGPGRTVAEAVKTEERASYTLGPEPTSPRDLANVAATIMSGGMWCPADPIASIIDRHGKPVPLDKQPCQRAISEDLADSLAAALSQDTTVGTAADAATAAGWTRPMIGKTGTTQQSESAAFVGATPQYAGAVLTWSDGPAPRPICIGDPPRQCAEGNLTGGTIPARTWFATMAPLHVGTPVAPLPPAGPDHRSAPA